MKIENNNVKGTFSLFSEFFYNYYYITKKCNKMNMLCTVCVKQFNGSPKKCQHKFCHFIHCSFACACMYLNYAPIKIIV